MLRSPIPVVRSLLCLSFALAALSSAETLPTTVAAPSAQAVTLVQAVQLSATTAAVQIARMDGSIARAGSDATQAALLPNIALVGGVSRARNYQSIGDAVSRITPTNDFNGRVQVGQAILDLEAWYRDTAAERQIAVAESLARVTLEEAAAGAASAYVSLATAGAQAGIAREDLGLAEELLTQAKARVEAGAAEAISETRANTLVLTARSILISAEGSARQASIRLARALNVDPGVPLRASEAVIATSLPTTPATADSLAKANRPELKASADTIAALDAARKSAQGATLPRIDGFADGGRGGPAFDDTVTSWRIGVGITVPIFDGSRDRAEQAALRVAQERLRGGDLSERIIAEVRDALVAMEIADARTAAERETVALADQELSQARARFEAGAAGNLEVIDAQRTRVNARLALTAAISAQAQSRIALAKACGVATTLR